MIENTRKGGIFNIWLLTNKLSHIQIIQEVNFLGIFVNAPNMIDVTAALSKSAEEYERAWSENNIEKMQSLLSSNPDLANTLFNSDKFNTLLDEVKATQRYYKVKRRRKRTRADTEHAIGIKDNASSDEEKKGSMLIPLIRLNI